MVGAMAVASNVAVLQITTGVLPLNLRVRPLPWFDVDEDGQRLGQRDYGGVCHPGKRGRHTSGVDRRGDRASRDI
jgi:hypothetical protein